MHEEKIILIDLDYTLIDTERIKASHERILRHFGISARASKEAYKKVTRRKPYHPAFHMRALITNDRLRGQAMREYWQLFEKRGEYNFPGVMPFLKALSRKYRLVLLSLGDKDFQLRKVRQSGFGKFFATTIITRDRRKEKELLRLFERHGDDILLLDDSAVAISVAHSIGMKTIRVRKGEKI